jgi:hypothetical protein
MGAGSRAPQPRCLNPVTAVTGPLGVSKGSMMVMTKVHVQAYLSTDAPESSHPSRSVENATCRLFNREHEVAQFRGPQSRHLIWPFIVSHHAPRSAVIGAPSRAGSIYPILG